LRHSGDGDIAAMNRFNLAVAQDMESLAQSRPAEAEPAYHNRLHTADVLVALTTLLHTQGAAADTHAAPGRPCCSPLRWPTIATTRAA
jgi:hypothetical protein